MRDAPRLCSLLEADLDAKEDGSAEYEEHAEEDLAIAEQSEPIRYVREGSKHAGGLQMEVEF